MAAEADPQLSNQLQLTVYSGPKRPAEQSLFVEEDSLQQNDSGLTQAPKRAKHDHVDSSHSSQEDGTPTPHSGHSENGTTSIKSPEISPPTSPETSGTAAPTKSQRAPKRSQPEVVNGKMQGYDAFAAEGRPQLAMYHENFKVVESSIKKSCEKIVKAYNEVVEDGYCNEEMHKVMTKIQDLGLEPKKHYPLVKAVSFLGPAGVGKSSSLVSILSQPGAAVESDSGSRGTSVVHEYSACLPDQTAKFAVVVRYMDQTLIWKKIKEHCRAILSFKLLTNQDYDTLDAAEIDALRDMQDNALDFFVTLLRDQKGFETEEAASEYFDERFEEGLRQIAKDILGHIEDLLASRGVTKGENTEHYTAETELELNEIFLKVSGPPGHGEGARGKPSIWPLLVKVEIHQDLDLLNAGVVLGDTPGISDTNLTVVHNTQSYLQNAGTIFVFAKPSRIKKDPSLDSQLRECIRFQKENSTYLIVTGIDQKADFKPIEKLQLLPEDQERLRLAEEDAERLRTELVELEDLQSDADNRSEWQRLQKRHRELEIASRSATMWVKEVAIGVRNRDIERSIKGKFRELSGRKNAPDLQVLFISNSEYQKHVTGYDVKDGPVLTIQGTGVPAIRKILYSLAARGKMSALKSIVTRRLPSAFDSIIGILSKSRLERANEVKNLISKVLNGDKELVDGILRDLEAIFIETVERTFKDNFSKWQEAAEEKLLQWSKMNGRSFAAFTRRSGDHKPKHGTRLIWNKEIRTILRNPVNDAFNIFEDIIDRAVENIAVQNMGDLFQKLKAELEGCEAFQGVEEGPFFDYIFEIKDNQTRSMVKRFTELKRSINFIRNKIALDDDERETSDSYISGLMQETYEQCQKLTATNKEAPTRDTATGKLGKTRQKANGHTTRVEVIRKRFHGSDEVAALFHAVFDEARNDFKILLDEWATKARGEIALESNNVLEDFDRRFVTAEVKEEGTSQHGLEHGDKGADQDKEDALKRDEEQKKLLHETTTAELEMLKEHLEPLLAECEAAEKQRA